MDTEKVIRELNFKAIRSSGAGGQHVNKVATKIELTFDIANSTALSETEKSRALAKLGNRLTKDKHLLLQCGLSRSQYKNKQLVIERFINLLKEALRQPKKRKRTKPTKSSVERRLQNKRKASEKKANRRRID